MAEGDSTRRSRLDADRQLGEDPLEALLQGEAQEELARLFACLDPKEKELLRLRFAGELTYAQMGTLLEMSAGVVEMAMNRLLHRLRESWMRSHG